MAVDWKAKTKLELQMPIQIRTNRDVDRESRNGAERSKILPLEEPGTGEPGTGVAHVELDPAVPGVLSPYTREEVFE